MSKILVYKTADGTISECTPVAKEVLQQELSTIGLDALRATHTTALSFETNRGQTASALVHTKRLKWLNEVKDLANLTDSEHQSFIHCHTPDNHVYHHWIDIEKMPKDRTYRDAWSDIDPNGNVTHDIEKAKQIQIARNHAAKQLADEASQKAASLAADPLATATINSIDDLKGMTHE